MSISLFKQFNHHSTGETAHTSNHIQSNNSKKESYDNIIPKTSKAFKKISNQANSFLSKKSLRKFKLTLGEDKKTERQTKKENNGKTI